MLLLLGPHIHTLQSISLFYTYKYTKLPQTIILITQFFLFCMSLKRCKLIREEGSISFYIANECKKSKLKIVSNRRDFQIDGELIELKMGKTYSANSADYKLLEEVGYGASATVYRAIYLPSNEVVAVKCLDLDRCNSNLVCSISSFLLFCCDFVSLIDFRMSCGFNFSLFWVR